MKLKNSINRILIVTICLTPFIITPGFSDIFYFPKAVFITIITLLIILKWILYENNKNLQIKNYNIVTKIALTYLGLIYISTIFSVDKLNSLFGISNRWESVITLSCYILLFIFSSIYFDFDIKRLKALVYSGTLMSFIGLLQFFRIIYFENFAFSWGRFTAAYGTLGNPNYLGAYLTIILPISIYLYISTKQFGLYLSSCLMYAVLILTMTRGAWVGILSGFMLIIGYFYRYRDKHKSILLLSFSFIVITLGFDLLLRGAIVLRFLSILFEFGGFVSLEGPDEMAGSSRIFTWTRILHSIPKKPFFGVGVSNLRYVFETYYYSDILKIKNLQYVILDRAHNEFLHIPMTTGVPSLISYIMLIGTIFIKMIREIKTTPIMVAFSASLIGYVIQSFFSSSIITHSFIFWIVLGASVYQINSAKIVKS